MKKIILILFAVVSWQHALSQTFTNGGLNYTVTSSTTVEVANQTGAATGTIAIPNLVTRSGSTYNVTRIGNFAFSACYGLTSITIPNSVTSIGENAFEFCDGLTSLNIPNSVTSIEQYALSNCKYLTSLTIPSSVTRISNGVLIYCIRLTSVTIPDTVTSIGLSAFSSCSSLTSITIPSSVTSIDYRAFYGCTSLTSVIIPSLVTSIGENAFESCSGLTSVTIPSSITSIGAFAFRFCTSLASLTCNVVTPLSINSNVFGGVNQASCSLKVPAGSLAAYQAAAVWKDFAPIISLDLEEFKTNSFKLYPNPVVSILNVKTVINYVNQPYSIIDGLGRVVLNGKLNEVETSINVEQLSKGIYYLKISGNSASKFIKE